MNTYARQVVARLLGRSGQVNGNPDMTPTDNTAARLLVRSTLGALAEATPATVLARLSQAYHPDAEWRGSHPMNELRGIEAMAASVWQPLLTAFPDLERRDTLLIGGRWNDGDWVGAVGHYCGTFRRDWLTIPATGRTVYIRYGEFHRVEGGKIIQSTVLIDVLDVIRQAGFWPVAPSLGTEEQWPCPFTGDGIVLTPQDPAHIRRQPRADARHAQNAGRLQ